jgi:hypothetical protein
MVSAISFLVLILVSPPLYSWGFSSKAHSEITQDALRFLRDDILISMIVGNIHEDDYGLNTGPQPGLESAVHFDACDFEDSSENIRDTYNDYVLPESVTWTFSPFDTAFNFGQLLHTVQEH